MPRTLPHQDDSLREDLFVRMLTGGDLIVEGSVRVEWRGRVPRALFVLLALQPGEPVARDRLADLLWPESDQQTARGNLRVALMALRRALGPAGSDLIAATSETLMLRAGCGSVDVSLFEALAERTDAASRQEALALYLGDLLSGVLAPSKAVDELLRAERERLRGLAVDTGLALMVQLEEAGDDSALSLVVRRVLAIDPANEPSHRAMMRFLIRAGDRAGALRQFDRCRLALIEHYEVAPAPETVALRDRIAGEALSVDQGADSEGAGSETQARDARAPRFGPASLLNRVAGAPGRLLAGAAAILVLAGLAWLILPARDSRREPQAPGHIAHVVLLPIELRGVACTHPELERRVRAHLEEALLAIPGVTLTLAGARVEDAMVRPDRLLLDVVVECIGAEVRLTVDARLGGSAAVEWAGRYDSDGHALDQVMARLKQQLRSTLESARAKR